MIVGIGDFRGGETLRRRVTPDEARKMRRLAGYDPSRGYLRPDHLPTQRSTEPYVYTGGAPPAQIPLALVNDTGVRILYRDASEHLWVQEDTTWDFAGRSRPCVFSDSPTEDVVQVTGAITGPEVGDQVRFGTDEGGVDPNHRYWVLQTGVPGGGFTITSGYGGTTPYPLIGDKNNTLQVVWCDDDIDVLADSAPVRVGNLAVFPTGRPDAKLLAYEPNGSYGIKARPLGMKSPLDYSATERPTVTASEHPQRQLFDIGATHWCALGTGTWTDPSFTDYQPLEFLSTCHTDQTSFSFDLGAAGKAIADRKYLTLDIVVRWTVTDPAQQVAVAGEFVNGDQQVFSSGFELRLYNQQTSHSGYDTDHIIRTYKIPQLDSTGRVNRVIFHLGTITKNCTMAKSTNVVTCAGHGLSVDDPISFGSSAGGVVAGTIYYVLTVPDANSFTFSDSLEGDPFDITDDVMNTVAPTVRGLGVRTASNFVAPAAGGAYVLWVYSYGFTPDWAFGGNCLLPVATFASGHWYDALPPDPGETGTSAVVLETFPESGTEYTPRRPWMRWCYVHRGRSELASADYWQLLSNPSLDSSPSTLADPWRTYDVTITLPANEDECTVLADYSDVLPSGGASYVTHLLIYRQERDAVAVWGERTFATALTLTDFTDTTLVYTDHGQDDEPVVDDMEVPEYVETNHDYPSSARFAMVADGRLYAACLNWSENAGVWTQAKDIEVSNYRDYGSFPTTTGDPPEETEGEELSGFADNSYSIKGLLQRQTVKFVFCDNAFYELLGEEPITGWQFLRRDAIGCISARTIADCRAALIWHGPDYFYAYAGGLAQPVSKGLIDSTLIDWSAPHGAVFAHDRYVFFCHYDDPEASTPYCLMVYDLETGSWRRRHSTSYQLAGICVDDQTGTIYGVDHTGQVVKVFGGTADYGGDTLYEAWTQYLVVAPPGEERHISNGVLEVVTDQASLNLTVDLYSQGRLNGSKEGITLTVYDHQALYAAPDLNCDLTGDAVAVRVRYTGTTPPEIHFIGVSVDEAVAG